MNTYSFMIDLIRTLECQVWNDSNSVRREKDAEFIAIRKNIWKICNVTDYSALDKNLEGESKYYFMPEHLIFTNLYALIDMQLHFAVARQNQKLANICCQLLARLKILQMFLRENDATTGDYI